MCGRFALAAPGPEIARLFNLDSVPMFEARYNIAPTQPVLAVRETAEQRRELAAFRWGLVPHWAKDLSIGARMINARSETVAEKPAFRTSLRRRRCLVPADGYYEWAKTADGRKQPHFIRLRDGAPFAFAGLWDVWEQGADGYIESCALLTTEPNDRTRSIHDRMPVILRPDDYDVWLDTAIQRPERLVHLFAPFPGEAMETYPVTTYVNSPSNDDPSCIAPMTE